MKPNLGPTQQLQLKPLEPSKKAEADPRYQLIMPSLGPSGIQLKPFFVYTLKGDKPQPEPGPQPDLSYHIQPPEGSDGHKQESTFGFDPNPPQSSQPAKAAKTGEPEEQNNPLHPEGKLYENKASKGVSGVSVAANTDPGVEAKVSIRDTVDIQAKASYPKQQGTFNLTFTVRLGDDLSTNGTKLDRERGETTLSQEGSKFLNNPKDLGQAQKAVDAVSKLIDAQRDTNHSPVEIQGGFTYARQPDLWAPDTNVERGVAQTHDLSDFLGSGVFVGVGFWF
jgi:hypothetical protein